MRLVFLLMLLISAISLQAQNIIPPSFAGYNQRPAFTNKNYFNDSIVKKKWFVTSYTGLSTGIVFYKGGHTSFVSAPMRLQINHPLNKNLYAFAGVAVAPSYFNNALLLSGDNKINQAGISRFNSFNMSSRIDLGLTYVNDAKKFSISGSIGVERSNYPVYQYNPQNMAAHHPIIYSK